MKKLNNYLDIRTEEKFRLYPINFYNSELIEYDIAKEKFEPKIRFTTEYIDTYREDKYAIFNEILISKIL